MENRMLRLMAVVVVTMVGVSAFAMDRLELNGLWDFRFEQNRSLEDLKLPDFKPNDKMIVPGAWDAMSHFYNQRGTGCYRRRFTLDRAVPGGFLVVDGASVRSKYWIDGREVGVSRLPWGRFEFATGPLAAGEHELVAAVDSIVNNQKVKLFWDFYDFYAFGGFHRGIWLDLQSREQELRRVFVRTRDFKTGTIELEAIYAQKGPADFSAEVAFDGGQPRQVAFKARRATMTVPGFKLWSPEHPNLHTVEVRSADLGRATARFGVRQVGTADGMITLNGEKIYLKGVNRHESHYEFGVTTPKQLMYEDIRIIKDLGGNFIRGAHYAQNDDFLTLCDELGVLVWEESLGWGNGPKQLDDPSFCGLQEYQTRLMVRNSFNHPSVIISAFLNEPQSGRPSCKKLVDRLIKVIRDEDTGHLVTFACSHWKDDISHANTDIIAYNVYPCWYSHQLQEGSTEEMRANIRRCHDEVVKRFRSVYKDKRPIIVSETGVKADYGARDPRGRAQFTEDYQAEYERLMLEEIFANPEISGLAIWQFTDAKTYTRRTSGMIMRSYGVNTGGLYDLYRRPKQVVEEIRKAFHSK